jgi:hypothetical protein
MQVFHAGAKVIVSRNISKLRLSEEECHRGLTCINLCLLPNLPIKQVRLL